MRSRSHGKSTFLASCSEKRHRRISGTATPASLVVVRLVLTMSCFVMFHHGAYAHVYHIDQTDDEIREMNIEDLLHVKNDFRKQNAILDKHVASLNGRMEKLSLKQRELDRSNKKISSAKSWESRQKESKDREYMRVKADTEAKRAQIGILAEKGQKLRREINALETKMRSLQREKRDLEAKYLRPSLRETLLHEAERMGPVPQHLLLKTMDDVVPELEEGIHEAKVVHSRLEHSSGFVSLFSSFCVYIFGLSVLCLCYRCVRVVHKMLTLPRMLFTVDMAFVLLWMLTLLCFATILEDPFQLMTTHHGALSVVVQMIMMASLIGNVMLRYLLLSSQIGISSFVEVFWAVLLAQHYYQAIWVPFLLDQPFKSTAMSYFGYFLVHISLAVHRARSVGRISKFSGGQTSNHGSKLESHSEWFKRKLESTLHYCEDMLTTGRPVSLCEVESLTDDNSMEELRQGASQRRRPDLRDIYEYLLPSTRPGTLR